MKLESLHLAGVGTWLPPRVPVDGEVAAGRCDRGLHAKNDIATVTVAAGVPPPEMAARAAVVALARSGREPDDVAAVLHASLFDQGHDLWAPASYVQRRALPGNRAPALEVRQVSNGGLAALWLAAELLASGDRRAALITAADRFDGPRFDRFHTDPGTVYADGGTALVVARDHGFARVHSLALSSEPELEGMHRGGDAFGEVAPVPPPLVDLDAHKRGFVDQAGTPFVLARVATGQRRAVDEALADAGVGLADIRRFLLPHFGRRRLLTNFVGHLGVALDDTTWDYARTVGHLGAGDHLAALEHLMLTGAVGRGDHCLLLGVGAGFSWSAAVVEITERPHWAAAVAA
jgi:3-oxoacyl-[acyl-carrier-protein] synthase-3